MSKIGVLLMLAKIEVCHLSELRDNPEYYAQKRSLVQLQKDRPWYKDIHADVLQDMVKRVKLSFDRFLKGDCHGKKSGKPRFKGKNRYRTFTFARVKADCLQGNQVELPKLGFIKVIQHRPLPDRFEIKTASVTKKADGFYITLSLVDNSVPRLTPDQINPTESNSIGIDMGLEKLAALSTGELIPVPQYFRKAEAELEKLQQKASDRKKGSRARKLIYRKVGKLHQKIARQRKQFHFETARDLVNKADVLIVEDLQLTNMTRRNKVKHTRSGHFLPNGQSAKSGMNKSFESRRYRSILRYPLIQSRWRSLREAHKCAL